MNNFETVISILFVGYPLSVCRPFSEEELRSNAPQVVTCNDYSREVTVSQNVAGKHFDRVFTFDKVLISKVLIFCLDFFYTFNPVGK